MIPVYNFYQPVAEALYKTKRYLLSDRNSIFLVFVVFNYIANAKAILITVPTHAVRILLTRSALYQTV